MTTYEVLSRHGTAAALKVAVLAFIVLVLRIAVLPFVVVVLILDRSIKALNSAVAKVPAAPLTRIHVSEGARC